MATSLRWIVSVSSEHDNPLIFGPYSKKRAEAIAESVQRSCEKAMDAEEIGWMHAGCYPIRNLGPDGIREHLGIGR
jgi:hypothetical protein